MSYSTPQAAQEQAAPNIDDALENESPNRTKVNLLTHKPAFCNTGTTCFQCVAHHLPDALQLALQLGRQHERHVRCRLRSGAS